MTITENVFLKNKMYLVLKFKKLKLTFLLTIKNMFARIYYSV